MSKLSFTIVLPHDKTNGNRTPGFYISTSNLTYLNVKGRDFRAARWGNGNASSGWKNRFEYGVTASKGATKLSLIMNTSVILPPVSWTLPLMGEDSPKKKESDGQKKRASSGSSSPSGARSKGKSSRTNHTSRSSRERGRPRQHPDREREYRPERSRMRKPRQIEDREVADHRHRHSRERRRERSNTDPELIARSRRR
ncbi:hypothetical protein QTJ16_003400 [Diplocarpon rosae]|uniref:Uncharacterized protein n=1 Tax=Diplocarpon rosae TaxID=946125 RepID=A0AAD9T299_9HELO|nr:hypothetical protein QTJ16_003400 [Diplocarpon rosae]